MERARTRKTHKYCNVNIKMSKPTHTCIVSVFRIAINKLNGNRCWEEKYYEKWAVIGIITWHRYLAIDVFSIIAPLRAFPVA